MKLKMIAILLIALGVVALAYQGITFTTRDKVVDVGPVHVTTEKTNRIPLPPILGAIALIGGIVLLLAERKRLGHTAASVLFAGVLAMPGAPVYAAFQTIEPGIYRIDSKTIDDLLTIPSHPDLDVLVLEDNETKSVSDAHMSLLRQWVESGGVLWVAGDGLESALAQTVAPFRLQSFDFVRSSSGNRGGELIVRGLSPRMTIGDHELTTGVSQLYLFARSKFDGTERAVPLVQMGDSAGNSGWVLVAVPVGRGMLILDGTARKQHLLFRRLKGFDEAHPNSLEQDSGWNSYDWDTLLVNARDHARQALADVGTK